MPDILPVSRTKDEAKRTYDRISGYYDYLTGFSERKYAEQALKYLSINQGETVLKIGFGTGYCLKCFAESVGQNGKAYGIDISTGMAKRTIRRLEKAELINRVELTCNDAKNLPYADNMFNAVFTSFVIELFDTLEIPEILGEIFRVLKPNGRLGIASMSKENGRSIMLRGYEWLHVKFPKFFDCRPIYLERSIVDAGFDVVHKEKEKLFFLPVEIVIAKES